VAHQVELFDTRNSDRIESRSVVGHFICNQSFRIATQSGSSDMHQVSKHVTKVTINRFVFRSCAFC